MEDIDGVVAIYSTPPAYLFWQVPSEKFTEEGIEPDGIVVLLMDMDPANFKIVLKDFEAPSIAYEKGMKRAKPKPGFEHLARLFSTADISIPGEEIIKGLMIKQDRKLQSLEAGPRTG